MTIGGITFTSATVHAQAEETPPLTAIETHLDTQQIINDINNARLSAGLPTLRVHPLLMQAAQVHADDMTAHSNYSHTGTDGSHVNDRVRRTGYSLDGWSSENWVSVRAAGQAIQWWMNSYVHRNNILNAQWQELGVGQAQHPHNGQVIFVAVFAHSGNAAPIQASAITAAPAPAVQPAAAQPVQAAAPASANAAVGSAAGQFTTYQVQPGDTLSSVALRHNMSWQELASLNQLQEHSLLQIGQTIRLAPEPAPAEAIAASQQPDLSNALPYSVQAGDTLVTIAARHNLAWQDVASSNNMGQNDVLQIGQQLLLPVEAESTSNMAASSPAAQNTATSSQGSNIPEYHTVQTGETIIHIAAKYGLLWKPLLARNGLSEQTVLRVGQRIRLR